MSHVAVENALSLDQQVRDGSRNVGGGETVREAAPLTGGWRRTGWEEMCRGGCECVEQGWGEGQLRFPT